MNRLKISIVQSELSWEDPIANRSHFDRHLGKIGALCDIVVLCEMFTTGFSMNTSEIGEHYDDKMITLNWMREWADKLGSVITGSVSVEDNGRYYNRLFWVRPDGSFSVYDKRHTFSFATEDQHYDHGNSLLIEEWGGWRICPLICYDLRFPVWSRNKLMNGKPLYDVLIYVANWPEVRREPWKKLLLARAIENQCYVIAGNRVGSDANGLSYVGDSAFINPRGEYLYELRADVEEISMQELSWNELEEFRKKFPVLNDADIFNLT